MSDDALCAIVQAAMPDLIRAPEREPAMHEHLVACQICAPLWAEWRAIAGMLPQVLVAPPPPEAGRLWAAIAEGIPNPAPSLAGAKTKGNGWRFARDLFLAEWRLVRGEVGIWSSIALVIAVVAFGQSRLGTGFPATALALLLSPIGMILTVRLWGSERMQIAPEIAGTLPIIAPITQGCRALIAIGSQVLVQIVLATGYGALSGGMTPGMLGTIWIAPLLCAMTLALLATTLSGVIGGSILSLAVWLTRGLALFVGKTGEVFVILATFWSNTPLLLGCTILFLFLTAFTLQRRGA